MRLANLQLIRYGKFTDVEIPLPRSDCDFHLFVGPNEAGKSTLRSAVSELLFGFPVRSRAMSFLHPQSELRLGGLIADDKQSLNFVRIKANKNSLRTSSDEVIADNELDLYLGATDKDFFEQMFALDHLQLVRGGETILDASKDVSQVLFQSAAGVAGLGEIKASLLEERDRL